MLRGTLRMQLRGMLRMQLRGMLRMQLRGPLRMQLRGMLRGPMRGLLRWMLRWPLRGLLRGIVRCDGSVYVSPVWWIRRSIADSTGKECWIDVLAGMRVTHGIESLTGLYPYGEIQF